MPGKWIDIRQDIFYTLFLNIDASDKKSKTNFYKFMFCYFTDFDTQRSASNHLQWTTAALYIA